MKINNVLLICISLLYVMGCADVGRGDASDDSKENTEEPISVTPFEELLSNVDDDRIRYDENGNIIWLNFSNMNVKDEDLIGIEFFSSLLTIDLMSTDISDVAVVYLSEQIELQEIVLTDTQMTREAVYKLREFLPEAYIIW